MKHPLTYAETLIDYHLCPHPKYKFVRESHRGSSIPLTQKQFLHHTVMAELALGYGEGRADKHGWAQLELGGRSAATVTEQERYPFIPPARLCSCPVRIPCIGNTWPFFQPSSFLLPLKAVPDTHFSPVPTM